MHPADNMMAVVDQAAERLTALETDIPGVMQAVAPLLAPAITRDLSWALDLCPMHLIDVEICMDDEVVECREART